MVAIPKLFQCSVFKDDTRAKLLTSVPIWRFLEVDRDMEVSLPPTCTIQARLADKTAVGLSRGNWVELQQGIGSPQMWFAGYINQVNKAWSNDSYSINLDHAAAFLADRILYGGHEMAYPKYHGVVDFLNGVHPAGQPATPGTKGILDGTGFTAEWVGTGTVPGDGDSVRADWSTRLEALDRLCTMYGLYWRVSGFPKRGQGVIQFGPLSDPSGLAIYGQESLYQKLATIYPNRYDPNHVKTGRINVADVQQAGLSMITEASYEEKFPTLYNIAWGNGHGSYKSMITLQQIFGNVADSQGNPDTSNGVSTWQPEPYGPVYYVRSNNKIAWNGHSYEMIAVQGNLGDWWYGVVDRTSVALYGPREYYHHDIKSKDPYALASYLLGILANSSNPPQSWTFTVKPPFNDSTKIPHVPLPGQTADVHFKGEVTNATDNDNFTGQYQDVGPFVPMEWGKDPQGNPITDPQVLGALNRIVKVTDTWTGQAGYSMTLEFGKLKTDKNRELDVLAHEFHRGHGGHGGQSQEFVEKMWGHLKWWFSRAANNDGLADAWEDAANEVGWINPGGYIVSDVGNDIWIGDHQEVEFEFDFTDNRGYLDIHFCKPAGGGLAKKIDVTPKSYAVARIAGATSGVSTGFKTTSNGTAMTKRGHLPHKRVFAPGHPGGFWGGKYRVRLHRSGGKYELSMSYLDGQAGGLHQHQLVAVWHENNPAIQQQGCLGFYYRGGSTPCQIKHLSVKPKKAASRVSVGGGKNNTHGSVSPPGGGHAKTRKQVKQHPSGGERYLPKTSHVEHDSGHKIGVGSILHGDQHKSDSSIKSISGNTVLINDVCPHNAMHWNDLVLDYDDNYCTIQTVVYDSLGSCIGFTTNDPIPGSWAPGTLIEWDPLDGKDPETVIGMGKHFQAFTLWKDKHSGTTQRGMVMVSRSGDAPPDGSGDFVTYPNGEIRIGETPITQPNGEVVNVASLAQAGDILARKFMKSGGYIFDASEFNSKTQAASLWASGNTSPIVLLNNGQIQYLPTSLLVGTAPNQTVVPAAWVQSAAVAADKSQADALLALTVGPYNTGSSTVTVNTTRWYDTTSVHADINLNHDQDIEILAFVGVDQASTPLAYGSTGTLLGYNSTTRRLYQDIDTGSFAYIAVGDKFIVEPSTANQETYWIESVNSDDYSYTINTAPPVWNGSAWTWTTHNGYVRSHVMGSLLVQQTSNYPPNHDLKLYAPMAGDAPAISYLTAAIDAIAVGLYGQWSDGTTGWARFYWGDPEWQAEYALQDGQGIPVWMGHLASANNKWQSLSCKASEVGLWGHNLPRFTVLGLEIAVHSANPTAGLVTYFDAYYTGFVSENSKLGAGSVGSSQLQPGSVTGNAKDPSTNADLHVHSDVTYFGRQGTQVYSTVAAGSTAGTVTAQQTPIAGFVTGPIIIDGVSCTVTGVAGNVLTISGLPAAPTVGGVIKQQTDNNWFLHWKDGTIVILNGKLSQDIAIHGGTVIDDGGASVSSSVDYPNIGVPLVPLDAAGNIQKDPSNWDNVKGNVIVFNSSPSPVQVKDPGMDNPVGSGNGYSWIPGYSATGGAHGQSTGFGVVTSQFDWTARPGGSSGVINGPNGTLWRVAVIDQNVDSITGYLQMHAPSARPPVTGDGQLPGSTAPTHLHHTVLVNVRPHGLNVRVTNSHGGNGTADIQWDAGLIETDAFGFGPFSVNAGPSQGPFKVGSYLCWDYTNPTSGLMYLLPPGTNFELAKNKKWIRLFQISRLVNSRGNYTIVHLHSGTAQIDSDSLTSGILQPPHFGSGVVGTPALAPAAVTTPILANGAVAAPNLGPKAVTPPAMSDSSPGKYTWAGMVFQLVAYNQVWNWGGGSMSLSSQVGVSWNYSGALTVAGGGTEYFPVPTISYTPGFIAQRQGGSRGNGGSFGQMVGYLNQWLIYNYTGSAITCNIGGVSTSIPDDSFAFVDGFTDKDGIYVVGVLTASTDGGWPWLATIHGAAAQMRGIHIGDDTIHNGHLTDNAVLNNNIQPSVLTWNRMLYIATYAAPAVHYSGLTNGSSSIFTEIPSGSIQRTAMSNLVADDQMFWQYATGSGGTINNGPDGSPKPAKLWNEQGHGAGPDNSNTVGVGFTYVCRSSNGSAAVLRGLNIDHADANGQPDGTVGVDFWYNNASGDAECWIYLTAYAPVHV